MVFAAIRNLSAIPQYAWHSCKPHFSSMSLYLRCIRRKTESFPLQHPMNNQEHYAIACQATPFGNTLNEAAHYMMRIKKNRRDVLTFLQPVSRPSWYIQDIKRIPPPTRRPGPHNGSTNFVLLIPGCRRCVGVTDVTAIRSTDCE